MPMRFSAFFSWYCLENATAVFPRVEIEPTLVSFESAESAKFMRLVNDAKGYVYNLSFNH